MENKRGASEYELGEDLVFKWENRKKRS